jgi:hypothetical protein
MFVLIGNSGSNHNYIGLTLVNRQPQDNLAYHNQGTHGGVNVVDISNMSHDRIDHLIKNDDPLFMVCFASKWNTDLYTLFKRFGINVIQIIIDSHRECMLINWQEKLRINAMDDTDRIFSKEWEQQQRQTWSPYTKFPIERAVMEWTYKLYDNEFIDVKQSLLCDQYFSFGSMYESINDAVKEFDKFGIRYNGQRYEKWRQSQKLIFDSWQAINNNFDAPGLLKHDYQKGMAIALRGMSESLTPTQCWKQYEQLLKVKS